MNDIAYSVLFGAAWIVLALSFISGRIKEVRDEIRKLRRERDQVKS